MKNHQVVCGLDRLDSAEGLLRGRRVGLITNHSGVDRAFISAVDLIYKKFQLTALIAPEHGIRGDIQAGEDVPAYRDSETGVMVYSAYTSKSRTLNEEMLSSFDILVYDIQDVGLRFYTYLYSLANAMTACASAGKPLLVLDRPNPLGGEIVQGTVIQEGFESFAGDYALPTRYGLTVAEYARYVCDFLHLDLDLHWIKLQGWERGMLMEKTGLPWVPPSPNLPHFSSVLCYAGTCIFEGTNLSEGRGTPLPFEQVGAPWLDARSLEWEMNRLALPGVMFRKTSFVPSFSKHQGKLCRGVQLHVTDSRVFDAFKAGLLMMEIIQRMHTEEFAYISWSKGAMPALDRLLGTDDFREGRMTAQELILKHAPLAKMFQETSQKFLLY